MWNLRCVFSLETNLNFTVARYNGRGGFAKRHHHHFSIDAKVVCEYFINGMVMTPQCNIICLRRVKIWLVIGFNQSRDDNIFRDMFQFND